jgi:hypothetical protein
LQQCEKKNAIADDNVERMKNPVSLSYIENKNSLFILGRHLLMYPS